MHNIFRKQAVICGGSRRGGILFLGCVHTLQDGFSCLYAVYHEQQRSGRNKSFTHRTSCGRGWPRAFGALNSSPLSWIFTSVSVGSSPCSYLFTSATVRIGVYTAPKYGTKTYPICNFRDRRGAASLPPRNLAEITVLVCEQKPYPYFCGREAMQCSLNIALC